MRFVELDERNQGAVRETASIWTEVIDFYLSCGFTITHTEVGEFGEDTWFERRI